MKIALIKAYKSADGCIWENENDAMQQNIDDCIGHANIEHNDSYSTICNKIKLWMKNHPKDVRYILANVRKLDLE